MNTTLRTLRALIATIACAVLAFGVYSASAHDDHGTPEASPMASPAATPNASPVAGVADSPTAVELKTGEMKFAPKSFTIPANTDVTLTITNKGMLPHDFVVPQAGINSGTIASGATVELTLNLSPGTYEFYCSVPGHKQAGMIGTIVVE